MTERAHPWTVDFDMNIKVSAPPGFRTAFKRGRKDGENYLRRFQAGEQGILIKDRYATNPYHESDQRYREYNKGFNDGCEYQVHIG